MVDEPAVELLGRSWRTLELSVRARNVLSNEGLQTIGDLTCMTARELRRQPNIGRVTVREIERQLARHGLSLAFDCPRQPNPTMLGIGVSNVVCEIVRVIRWRDQLVAAAAWTDETPGVVQQVLGQVTASVERSIWAVSRGVPIELFQAYHDLLRYRDGS